MFFKVLHMIWRFFKMITNKILFVYDYIDARVTVFSKKVAQPFVPFVNRYYFYQPITITRYWKAFWGARVLKVFLLLFVVFWLCYADLLALCFEFYHLNEETGYEAVIRLHTMFHGAAINCYFYYLPRLLTLSFHFLMYFSAWTWVYYLSAKKPPNSENIRLGPFKKNLLILNLAFIMMIFLILVLGYISMTFYENLQVEYLVDIAKYVKLLSLIFPPFLNYYILFQMWGLCFLFLFFLIKRKK